MTAGVLKNIGNLYEYYRYILENSRVDIFVFGNISSVKTMELTGKYFPYLKSRDIISSAQTAAAYKRVEEGFGLNQAKLCVGIDMGQGERCEKQIFNEILGGNGNSRLFAEIREKRNLCYYIGSTFYSLANAVIIQAGIQKETVGEVLNAVEEQLEKQVSETEIEQAKKAVIARTKGIYDQPFALMDLYLTQSLFGKELTEVVGANRAMEEIGAVKEIALSPKICTVYMMY